MHILITISDDNDDDNNVNDYDDYSMYRDTVSFPGCIYAKEEEKQEFVKFMILLASQRQRPCLP